MEGFLLFWFLAAIVVIVVLAFWHQGQIRKIEERYRAEAQRQEEQYRTEVQRMEEQCRIEIMKRGEERRIDAERQLSEWKAKELGAIQERAMANLEAEIKILREKFGIETERWKEEYEASIRADAIARSQAVILGRTTEHLIPHMSAVFPYNPKEARFIGSPIDMVVFDGVDSGEVREVVFLEIKSGDAGLSPRQRQIRDAIQNHRVVWRELHLPQPQT